MNKNLYESISNLKTAIRNSGEYKALVLQNELLEKSDEVKVLSYRKDVAIMEYEDALKHFHRNSVEVLNTEKRMSKAIYDLNNHKLVKEYNLCFANLNKVFEHINEELFDFFKGE